jgi:hypothetical protein
MRLSLGLVLGWVMATGAHAQSADKKPLTPQQYRLMMEDMEYWDQQRKRYGAILQRVRELNPGRRDTPLRALNISDGEVREVQGIAARHLPRALVNISPVVTDCPCEEGPNCTAQVYVLATAKEKTTGLQLSRTKEHWDVGVVQKWRFRWDAVQKQNTGNAFLDDYLWAKAHNDLLEEFPMCVAPPERATESAAALKSVVKTEGKK